MTEKLTDEVLAEYWRGQAYGADSIGAKLAADRMRQTADALSRRATPADDLRAETAAWAMWKAEAAEGTPKSIYEARTIDAFRSGLNPDDRERWLRKGRAVVAALAQKGDA